MNFKERSVVFMLILSILIAILPNSVYAGNAFSKRQLHNGVQRDTANVEEENPTFQEEDNGISEDEQSEGTNPDDEEKLSEDGASLREDSSSVDEASTETEDTISEELPSESESVDSEQENIASEVEEYGKKKDAVDADEKETDGGENTNPDQVEASPENGGSQFVGEPENGASDETDTQPGNASNAARDSSDRYGETGYVEEETGKVDTAPDVLNEVMGGEAVESEFEEELSTSTQSQEASAGTYYSVSVIGNGGRISSIHDGNEVISVGNVSSVTVLIEKGKGILIPNKCVSNSDSSLFLAGWSLSQGGCIVATYNEQYIPTGNCKLYAVWKNKKIKGTRTYGDVNSDGTIRIDDITLILRAIAAIDNSSTREEHPEWLFKGDDYEQADLTHDGFLDTQDNLILLRYIAASNNDEIRAQHPDWLLQESFYTYDLISLVSRIALNHSNIEVESGKTIKLSASIEPSDAGDKSIKWSSNNTSVVTVDSYGTVRGVSVGTATIEALAGDGSGVKASCLAKVTKPISSCTITLSQASYIYDGTEKKPAVTVKDGNSTLRSGTDYYINNYNSNTNAGTAYVEITGKGYYTGTVRKPFTISKATPSLAFSSTSVTKQATDGPFTNALNKKTDGAVSFTSSNLSVATVNSSTGQVTIKGVLGRATITANATAGNNYNKGSASYTLTVAKPISSYTVTVSPSAYVYDGNEKKPSVTIQDGNTTLLGSIDYSVLSYTGNINAGTAYVEIAGSGYYTGTVKKSFTISKAAASLSFSKTAVSKLATDGSFTNKLTKKTDGIVGFSSSNTAVASVNSSTGKVTIKGAGTTTITAKAEEGNNYNACSASYTLTVKKKKISSCTVKLSKTTCIYTGKALKPIPVVKLKNKTLKKGTDYTVSYKNNINAGKATFIVTGKGKYTGKITGNFKITKAAPKLTFSSKNISKTIDGKAFINKLKKETDGALSFTSSNKKVATVNKKTGKVTIKGIGETTITVKSKEGNNYKAGEAKYNLTVYTGIK